MDFLTPNFPVIKFLFPRDNLGSPSRTAFYRNENFIEYSLVCYPAGKIAEKAVWRSAFLTIWHCILNADSTKTHSFTLLFLQFCRLGFNTSP